MARAWFLVGCLLMTLSYPAITRADGLRNVERATSGGGRSSESSSRSSQSSSRSSSSSSSSYESDDDDSEGCGLLCESSREPDDSFWFVLMAYTLASPWLVPRQFDDPSFQRYAPYPFADGPGLLRRPALPGATDTSKKVAIALDAESGYMLQGVVPSGLALRVLLPHRFELDARLSGLSDVTTKPVAVGSAGTAHLTLRFAQGQRYDFRTGVGLRAFSLDSLHLGFDILYGVDTYLGRRMVWRVELHLGSAGEAFVGQARSTLGAMFSRFEVYAGYDHTAYLSATSDASLGGPIAGLRAWF